MPATPRSLDRTAPLAFTPLSVPGPELGDVPDRLSRQCAPQVVQPRAVKKDAMQNVEMVMVMLAIHKTEDEDRL